MKKRIIAFLLVFTMMISSAGDLFRGGAYYASAENVEGSPDTQGAGDAAPAETATDDPAVAAANTPADAPAAAAEGAAETNQAPETGTEENENDVKGTGTPEDTAETGTDAPTTGTEDEAGDNPEGTAEGELEAGDKESGTADNPESTTETGTDAPTTGTEDEAGDNPKGVTETGTDTPTNETETEDKQNANENDPIKTEPEGKTEGAEDPEAATAGTETWTEDNQEENEATDGQVKESEPFEQTITVSGLRFTFAGEAGAVEGDSSFTVQTVGKSGGEDFIKAVEIRRGLTGHEDEYEVISHRIYRISGPKILESVSVRIEKLGLTDLRDQYEARPDVYVLRYRPEEQKREDQAETVPVRTTITENTAGFSIRETGYYDILTLVPKNVAEDGAATEEEEDNRAAEPGNEEEATASETDGFDGDEEKQTEVRNNEAPNVESGEDVEAEEDDEAEKEDPDVGVTEVAEMDKPVATTTDLGETAGEDSGNSEADETEETEDEPAAFNQEKVVNGVRVTVTAEPGVFPADAALIVERVPVYQERKADTAVEEIREEDKNVAVSYTFDIRVVDAEGNEIQPADGRKVQVTFALAEAADENLETSVYHVTEEENGELTAEKLEADVDAETETVTAITDGFSLYTVEFTYNSLEYVLHGGESATLAEILDTLGLTGTPEEVTVSNPELFSASDETGEWIVTAHRAFSSQEWMKVTLSGIVYNITVTDAQTAGSYKELVNAINNGGEITITKNFNIDDPIVVTKSVTIDLNGHTLKQTMYTYVAKGMFDVSKGVQMVLKGPGTLQGLKEYTNRNGDERLGGCIYVNGGKLTIEKVTIKGFYAEEGGAICVVDNGTLIMKGGAISECKAYISNGGAICVKSGTLELRGGTIEDNYADDYGGGIYFAGNGDCTIGTEDGKEVYITGNFSKDHGGGISFAGSGKLTVNKHACINLNEAEDNGGGLFISAGNVEINGTYLDTDIKYNKATNGGGIYLKNGNLYLNGGCIWWNEASKNGGNLLVCKDANVTVTAFSFVSGFAQKGAGIYNDGEITMTQRSDSSINDRVYFSSNIATSEGGGFLNSSSGILTMTGGMFKENETNKYGGAGLLNYGTATLTNVTFTENHNPENASAVYTEGTTKLISCTIEDNWSTGSYGAAVYDKGSLYLYGTTTIKDNTGKGGAGGIIVDTDGWLYAEGAPVIQDNRDETGKEYNVWLAQGKKAIITGPLDPAARIGVSTKALPTSTKPVVITSNLGQLAYGDESNFTSDNPIYFLEMLDDEAILKKIRVTFDKGDENAGGTMDYVEPTRYQYIVPACGFTAPSGKDPFVGWMMDGDAENLIQPGDEIDLSKTGSITLTAIWMTPWRSVQRDIDNCLNGRADYVYINQMIYAEANDVALVIPAGKIIEMRLNGGGLNRNLKKPAERGCVIRVQNGAQLTIIGDGTITGGYNSTVREGGGIVVEDGGSLTLSGGTLNGNRSSNPRGKDIYLNAGQTVRIDDEYRQIYVNDLFITSPGSIILEHPDRIPSMSRIGVSFAWTSGFPIDVTDGQAFKEALLPVFQSNVSGYGIGWNSQHGPNAFVDENVTVTYEEIDNLPEQILARGTQITLPFCRKENRPGAITDGYWMVMGGEGSTLADGSPLPEKIYETYQRDGDGNPIPVSIIVNSDITLVAVWTMTWKNLQEAIDEAGSTPTTIKLSGSLLAEYNYGAEDDDTALIIPADATITIDLNGYTLDRNLEDAWDAQDGNVFQVYGKLTLTDSKGSGKITGGKAWGYDSEDQTCGGGVYVAPGGRFVFNGGTVTGNSAITGAGVYVAPGGKITLNGSGKIIENYNQSYVEENLYLPSDTQQDGSVAVASVISIGMSFRGGRYGITSEAQPDATSPLIYLTNGMDFAGGNAFCFISDDETYFIGEGEGREAVLGIPATIYLKDHNDSTAGETVTSVQGGVYSLPEPPFSGPSGQIFAGWQRDDDEESKRRAAGTQIVVDKDEITLTAYWGQGVRYIDESENNYLCENPIYIRSDMTATTESQDDAYVVLGISGSETWYAVDQDATLDDRMRIRGTVNLILCDGATLKATKGINLPSGNKLIVWCQSGKSGKLIATAMAITHAGIGGNKNEGGGAFIMHGGNVYAKGDTNAAGIGGGYGGSAGDVTIYGGTLDAKGGDYGAGIGGGMGGSQADAAGGSVVIWGGTVTATGGDRGAGIGGGQSFTDVNGTVGGGDCGLVSIWGGAVTATGGYRAAGIGGGEAGYGGTVSIGGTCAVEIFSGDINSAQAIGHGSVSTAASQERDKELTEGKLTLAESCGVVAGESKEYAEQVSPAERVDSCRLPYARISAGKVASYLIGVIPNSHTEVTVTDSDNKEITNAAAGEIFTVKVDIIDEESWLPDENAVSVTYQYGGETITLKPMEGSTPVITWFDSAKTRIRSIQNTYRMPRGNVAISMALTVKKYTITYPTYLQNMDSEMCLVKVLVNGKEPEKNSNGSWRWVSEASKDDTVSVQVEVKGDYYVQSVTIKENKTNGKDIPKKMGQYSNTWLFKMPSENVIIYGDIALGAPYLDEYGTRLVRKNFYLIRFESDISSISYTINDKNTAEDGWYYFANSMTISKRVTLKRSTTFILKDNVSVEFSEGIYVSASDGGSLTIYAQSNYNDSNVGRLYAYGNTDKAGIGGNSKKNAGRITINGGYIRAQSYPYGKTSSNSEGAAGIGGGYHAEMSKVTIRNATVYAYGAKKGAGIGGGDQRDCQDVEIFSGKVVAQGGENGAGIGGGYDGDLHGTVTIHGGDVTATGGKYGAGIGGCHDNEENGAGGKGGTVIIKGGIVHAYGGNDAAGIGSGKKGSSAGSLTVNDGEVYVKGGFTNTDNKGPAAIGGGVKCSGGNVTINGGYVYADAYDGGAAIGGANGMNGGNVTINGGTVTLNTSSNNNGEHVCIGAGSGNTNHGTCHVYADAMITFNTTGTRWPIDKKTYEPNKREFLTGTKRLSYQGLSSVAANVRISPCTHPNAAYEDKTDDVHAVKCNACENGIRGAKVFLEEHDYTGSNPAICKKCGHRRDHNVTTHYEPDNAGSTYYFCNGICVYTNPLSLIEGESFELVIRPKQGYELDEVIVKWTDRNNVEHEITELTEGERGYQFTMPKGDVDITVKFKLKEFRIYLDNQLDTAHNNSAQGVANVTPRTAVMDTQIKVNVSPFDDYKVDQVTVYQRHEDGYDIDAPIEVTGDGPYTFTMPPSDANVHISYKRKGVATVFAFFETVSSDTPWDQNNRTWSAPVRLKGQAKDIYEVLSPEELTQYAEDGAVLPENLQDYEIAFYQYDNSDFSSASLTRIPDSGEIELEDGKTRLYVCYTRRLHELKYYQKIDGSREPFRTYQLPAGALISTFTDQASEEMKTLTPDGYTFAGWSRNHRPKTDGDYTYQATIIGNKQYALTDPESDDEKFMPAEDRSCYPVLVPHRLAVVLDLGAYDANAMEDPGIRGFYWPNDMPRYTDTTTKAYMSPYQIRSFMTNMNEQIAMDGSRNIDVPEGIDIASTGMNAAWRDGYVLDGWYTQDMTRWNQDWGVSTDYCDLDDNRQPVMIQMNDPYGKGIYVYYRITLKAVWSLRPATVVYDPAGGYWDNDPSDTEPRSEAYSSSTATIKANRTYKPKKELSKFTEWVDKQGRTYDPSVSSYMWLLNGQIPYTDLSRVTTIGTGPYLSTDDNNIITLTARYKDMYELSLDPQGGLFSDNTSDVKVISRDSNTFTGIYDDANCPTKGDYTFAGWTEAPDKTEIIDRDNGTVSITDPGRRKTIYARWIKQYTIEFDTEVEGLTIDPITKYNGEPVERPADPQREDGFEFVRWEPELPTIMPEEDMTVHAKWKDIRDFTITFDTDGGSDIPPIHGLKDSLIDKDQIGQPTKDGYTFARWTPEVPDRMPEGGMTVKAQWTPVRYKIIFDTNGGNNIVPIEQDYDTDVTAPENPTKTGYTFVEWKPAVPGKMPLNGLTVTAQWKINQYTISFDTDGGSAVPAITQDYDTPITPPADPTKTDYLFDGWEEDIPAQMPAENKIIKAKWKDIPEHTITFEMDGGKPEIDPITQKTGTDVTAPANPTKEGYTFTGWDPAVPKTMPETDLTIKAQWKINQYSIFFDTDGGTAIDAITQDYHTSVTSPADPTKTGYAFDGWDKPIPDQMPAEDTTVKAKWIVRQFDLIFRKDDTGIISQTKVDYGAPVMQPEAPEKEGHTFTGWDQEIPATMPAENTTITAQWKINRYTITFDTDGGSVIAPITQDYDTAVTKPSDPTKTGYAFKGWSPDVPTRMPGEDTAVRAQWKIRQFTITFDTDGGSAIPAITADYGAAVTRPANPTRDGYDFIGWDKTIPTVMPADNLTIKAQWKEAKPEEYTLIYDTQGGTPVEAKTSTNNRFELGNPETTRTYYAFVKWTLDPEGAVDVPEDRIIAFSGDETIKTVYAQWKPQQFDLIFRKDDTEIISQAKVDYGAPVTPPETPTKEGHTFTGWDQEIPTTMPAENTTITAQWKINRYTITFDADGGTPVAAITKDYDSAVTKPADPTKTGYTFKGWSPDVPAKMPAQDTTVKAQWEIKQYTITFDTDGGSVIPAVTAEYGTAVTRPANPTREGYDFIGWDKTIPTVMPAENTTITAKWQINQYTLTFDTDGGSVIAPVTLDYDAAITAPADPKKAGYLFTGWTPEIPSRMPGNDLTVKAGWTAGEYTIIFDPTGGEPQTVITQKYGTRVTAPTNPKRTGYTFIGWDQSIPSTMPGENLTIKAIWETKKYTLTFVDADDETNVLFSLEQFYNTVVSIPPDPVVIGKTFLKWDQTIPTTMPAGDMTIRALFRINQYIITFDTDGGSDVPSITQAYNTPVTHPDDPKKTGYDFNGWDKEIPTTMPAGNMTIRAQWKIRQFTLTFDTDGGSAVPSITQDYDTFVIPPADPTREGYQFAGWEGGIPERMPAENKTIRAKWTEISKHTITFKDGESILGQIIQYTGTDVTPPTNPTKTGYTFSGWDQTIPKKMPDADLTITAVWKINRYSVFFDTDGGTPIDAITKDFNAPVTSPADPTKTGYTFTGWIPDVPTRMPAQDTTVKAQWEIRKYTITFDTDGGSAVPAITADYGAAVTRPADPTKEGNAFIGWDREIPSRMPAENITVKARWQAVQADEYTLVYDTQGGTEISAVTSATGQIAIGDARPTRQHYQFDKWALDPEGTVDVPEDKIIRFTGNERVKTVYAQWKPEQFKLTFMKDEKDIISEENVDYGAPVTAPAAPAKKGWTFTGWDKEIPATMPAQNITITAQWQINKYTITFDTVGGTVIAPMTLEYDAEITKPADPKKTGYQFAGWTTITTAGEAPEIPEKMPAEDITVKAGWSEGSYTITFDAGDGVFTDPESGKTSSSLKFTKKYGEQVIRPANPTKKGYTFNGWKQPVPSTMPDHDLVIEAQWIQNEYTLTFVDGDSGAEIFTSKHYYDQPIDVLPVYTLDRTFIRWEPEVPERMPAEDLTFRAIFARYTLNFETFGTAAVAPMGYHAFIIPAVDIESHVGTDPQFSGYRFAGWGTDLDAETGKVSNPIEEKVEFTEEEKANRNKTIYAIWEPLPYTIEYDVQGGPDLYVQDDTGTWAPAENNIISYAYGAEITQPHYEKGNDHPAYTAEGENRTTKDDGHYDFAGWEPALPEHMPAENRKVTAKWQPHQYTVRFFLQIDGAAGDEGVRTFRTAYKSTINVPQGFTNGDKVFKGWATTADGEPVNPPLSAYLSVVEDITYYAVWYDLQEAPEPPKIKDPTTYHSIEVENPVATQEYNIDGGEWRKPAVAENGQVQMIFDGLEPVTSHQIRTRLPENTATGQAASPASEPADATTDKAPQDPPAAPILTAGNGSISINAETGTEYMLWRKAEDGSSPSAENAVWVSRDGPGGVTFRDNNGNRIEPDPATIGYTVANKNGVITFGGLEKDAEYSGQARNKETEKLKLSGVSETSAGFTLTDVVTGVQIYGSTKLNQTLTSTLQPAAAQNNDQLKITRQWFRGNTPIEGATGKNYAITAEDLGRTLRLKVTQTFNSGAEPVVVESTVGPVTKAVNSKVPSPVEADAEPHSLTVTAPLGTEGNPIEYSRDLVSWQEGILFDGLEEETDYTLYARYAETATTMASEPSAPSTFTTPKVEMKSLTLSGEPVYGQLLTAEAGPEDARDITYEWYRNDEPIIVDTDGNGDPVIAGGQTYTLGIQDIGTVISVKAVQTPRRTRKTITLTQYTDKIRKLPSVLDNIVAITTTDTIRVTTPVTTEEDPEDLYKYSLDGNEWQDAPVFTGLIPDSEYTVYAKRLETDTHEESNIISTVVRTVITVANKYVVRQNIDGSWDEPEEATETLFMQFTAADETGFTVTGYSYDGFIEDEGERTAIAAGEIIVFPYGISKLYVYLKRNSYTLTFDSNGGTEVESITAPYGADITKPEDPKKENHIFKYWTLEDQEADIPDRMPDGSKTYKAAWRGTVRSELTGDTASEIKLDITEREIRTIAGSSAEAELENGKCIVLIVEVNKVGNPDEAIQAKIGEALSAKDATALKYLDISVYLKIGDEDPVRLTDLNGNKIRMILTVSKDHYAPDKVKRTFYIARYHGEEGSVITEGTREVSVPFESDLFSPYALGAADLPVCTITFETDGGSKIDSITQEAGTKVEAPDNPTKVGYTFKEWQLDGETAEIPETMPAEDQTYLAIWTINQYTITFYTAGGSAISSIRQNYNTEVKAPADPTREGYTFMGWDKEIPKKMPAENVKITARWKINQYTIVFDSTGGSPVSPITQDYGTAVTAPANPTRANYTFTGWTPAVPTTMPAENVTVKATWKLTNGKGVNTGDDTNMPLLITLLAVLVAGMAGFNIFRIRKKKRTNRN